MLIFFLFFLSYSVEAAVFDYATTTNVTIEVDTLRDNIPVSYSQLLSKCSSQDLRSLSMLRDIFVDRKRIQFGCKTMEGNNCCLHFMYFVIPFQPKN